MGQSKKYSVLLTGGIACGKTAISDYLANKGAEIIDTDLIARSLTEGKSAESQMVLQEIVANFGDGILTQEGALDRQKMRALIFADEGAKKILESLLHQRILQVVKERLSIPTQSSYYVVVVPLISSQSPYLSLCDEVLVVEVPYELQLQRLIERDKIDRSLAEQMIESQISRLDRRLLGRYIIVNQNRSFVERILDQLHQYYADM
ncbi:dephospho-CoA kinase [Ignatzschineria ureiclastica]|uniref:Dephospho-CoA kinase n=1 Tax=Ignatzschineria ureiclastica TaxID=472582 RepID=A0A2U2AGB4_9GAMM|nr:dephospho-CoA kinase [Ignatzschineria ureiclastica]PWD81695.1 dephospho-CoA kinase [Ignatzschineria ureiclastica]GGZ89973.1 dephospho-CoA kinase [Ignatzschineria ureiclastica]